MFFVLRISSMKRKRRKSCGNNILPWRDNLLFFLNNLCFLFCIIHCLCLCCTHLSLCDLSFNIFLFYTDQIEWSVRITMVEISPFKFAKNSLVLTLRLTLSGVRHANFSFRLWRKFITTSCLYLLIIVFSY